MRRQGLLLLLLAILLIPRDTSALTLGRSNVLRVSFTVDPNRFPIDPVTGSRRIPNLLFLYLGPGSGIPADAVIRLYNGNDILSSQVSTGGSVAYFNADDNPWAPAGTGFDFTPIRIGSIAGVIELYSPSADVSFSAPGVYLAESLGTGAFLSFGPVPSSYTVVPALLDSDGDALPDAWETGWADTDGDGAVDINLADYGASPNRKDVFVYFDWMEPKGFLTHTHRPPAASLEAVVNAFANAEGEPVALHPLPGHAIQEYEHFGTCQGNQYVWADFDSAKVPNFPPKFRRVAHYAIFAHSPGTSCGDRSGFARPGTNSMAGSDFVVTLGHPLYWTFLNSYEVFMSSYGTAMAGTLMHELGHNLGLRHGGQDDIRYKPNYLSVMNYHSQTRGIRRRLTIGPYEYFQEGVIDYSRFDSMDFPDVNEAQLIESDGTRASPALQAYGMVYGCASQTESEWKRHYVTVAANAPAVDWNCDGDKIDTFAGKLSVSSPGPQILRSYSDWARLIYSGGWIGEAGASLPELPEISRAEDSPELSLEEDKSFGPRLTLELPVRLLSASLEGPVSRTAGTIPIWISSSAAGFHADSLSVRSIRFGRTGTEGSVTSCSAAGGTGDLLCLASLRVADLSDGATTALLTAESKDGTVQVVGVADINIR